MGVHGTARFAERGELTLEGLLYDWPHGSVPDGLMVGWWYETEHDFLPVAYKGDLHQLIVAGIGGGKFTTCLAPMLLGSALEDQAVVVVDPKGEIASLVGPFFQKPFAERPSVHLLDPWDACGTGNTAVLTFLDPITLDNPGYADDARAIADAMIIPSGADNTHWDNAARNFLTALLLYLALDPAEEGKRDLVRLRELVTLPWVLPKSYLGPPKECMSTLLYSYLDNDLADGAIKRGFTSMINREDKERSGIISSLERETAWIDSPSMKKVLRGDNLDLKEAALGGGKYFIVIPPDYFMTHRAWLRLCVTAFARSFKRNKPVDDRPLHKRWRHIIIDEFPSLGEMSMLMTEVAISRGYEVKYHLTVQDFPQLRRVYGEGWESFVNNCFLRVFAINDQFTSEYVSRMLGTATVESRGKSYGTSTSRGSTQGFSRGFTGNSMASGGTPAAMNEGFSESTSITTTENWGETVSDVARPLRTPDEVRRLMSSAQFMFFRGMHPVECWRPPYWEIFPSLPDFSLKEVLGTVAREPVDDDERLRFERWKREHLLMMPKPLPPPVPVEPPLLPPPFVTPAPPPPTWWQANHRKVAICSALLLLAWWIWPSEPEQPKFTPVATETSPVIITPPSPPPVPVKRDPTLAMTRMIQKLQATRRVDLPVINDVRAAIVISHTFVVIVVSSEKQPKNVAIIDSRDGAEMVYSLLKPAKNGTFEFTAEDGDPYPFIARRVFAEWGYAPDRLRITFDDAPAYDVDLRRNPAVLALWSEAYPQFRPGKVVPRKPPS